jgi:hypothetical protein
MDTDLLALAGVESHDDFIHEGDIKLPREIEKTLLSKFMNQIQETQGKKEEDIPPYWLSLVWMVWTMCKTARVVGPMPNPPHPELEGGCISDYRTLSPST